MAERFGWQPVGTLPPEDRGTGQRWQGEYTGNTGQRVTAVDAVELAAGLRAALASAEFDGLVVAFGADFCGQLATASTPAVTLTAGPFPPDEWRRAAAELAAYCEGGGFNIH